MFNDSGRGALLLKEYRISFFKTFLLQGEEL